MIAPGYFSGAMAKPALKEFFVSIAAASPIPVMLYNYPNASGGIDLDSELVIDVAKEAPNTCGIKLTCGAVGKLTRITAATATSEFKETSPRKSASAPDFLTMGGFADFLLPTVVGSRAGGAIMGLGNVFPHALAQLMKHSLSLASHTDSDPAVFKKAIELQDLASSTDAIFARAGISGTKWWLQKHKGYPNGRVRRPLLDFDAEKGAALDKEPAVIKFLEIERALEAGK